MTKATFFGFAPNMLTHSGVSGGLTDFMVKWVSWQRA